jgi:hypothetical protein
MLSSTLKCFRKYKWNKNSQIIFLGAFYVVNIFKLGGGGVKAVFLIYFLNVY